MKRRGFLGLMGGAFVAGPGMAKQALSSTAQLAVPANFTNQFVTGTLGGPPDVDTGYFQKRFDTFSRLSKSAEWLNKRRLRTDVYQFDPDIAGYRSFSLDAKLRMQRDRNFSGWLARERGWLEQAILGDQDDY